MPWRYPIVRDLNAKYNPDLMVANIDICTFFPRLYQEGVIETATELHAGEVETSMILAVCPESVDMSKAVDVVPNVPRNYLSYGSIFRASKSGVCVEAKGATS